VEEGRGQRHADLARSNVTGRVDTAAEIGSLAATPCEAASHAPNGRHRWTRAAAVACTREAGTHAFRQPRAKPAPWHESHHGHAFSP